MSFAAPKLAPDVVQTLIRGLHRDPFAVLGPHSLQEGGVMLRVLRPHARDIEVIEGDGKRQPMTPVHSEGLFELAFPETTREDLDYRLAAIFPDGSVDAFDDAYRYGPVLTEFDRHLFSEGTHRRLYERLGAHPMQHGAHAGVNFAVWAPSARRVSVVGDFNRWDGRVHVMRALVPSGLWEIFVPGVLPGVHYKFEIVTAAGTTLLKTDPFGRQFEVPPRTAAIVWHGREHVWTDEAWLTMRAARGTRLAEPVSIYELHAGSWRRNHRGESLGWRELAEQLVPYVRDLGFTHIELLPIMEHPFAGSWGYQVIGFFAPTSRFGPPEDFQFFVDSCHRAGLGVLLDWVPGHFPKDAHGLGRFDGTGLFEHADPRQGEHQDWGTFIFNYGRHEVRAFLVSNALFWIEQFHLDGLRVDAVASMLYLDYSRTHGQWVPNRYGGRENLEAIEFLRELNQAVSDEHPGVLMMAEESTSWPGVSRPAHLGGLGFHYKWNMGWMHDMLDYVAQDPVHRKWHHQRITFSLLYAFSEHFILPFSHDEVVHGKRSLLDKMPGDVWRKHATLRALYGYMFAHPGKKLLFMGAEIGQWREWHHDRQLDWGLLDEPLHHGLQRWVRDLNLTYAGEPALWELDAAPGGFSWIDCNDHEHSIVSLLRFAHDRDDCVMAVVNFTPLPRYGYRLGVPRPGVWREQLNSDAGIYGGSNVGNVGTVEAQYVPSHGHPFSVELTVPPLGFLLFKPETASPLRGEEGDAANAAS